MGNGGRFGLAKALLSFIVSGRRLFLCGALAQDAAERIHILFLCRPARGKADDAVRLVVLLPDGEVHAFGERPALLLADDAEALVRRRVEAGLIAVFRHRAPDGAGVADGVRADALIEPVGEQRVELKAEQPPLGEQRAVLLDDGEKVRNEPRLRKDDRLAEQRAAFRAADVEDVAQRGKVAQRHVVFRTGKRIGKARTVDIERQTLFAAERADSRELLFGVERTIHTPSVGRGRPSRA